MNPTNSELADRTALLHLARRFRIETQRLVEDCDNPAWKSALHFDERRYLFSNPEIVAAIQRGKSNSALEHWVRYGWAEQRAGGPAEPVADRRLALPEMARRQVGLNIYGNFSAPSGIGGAARNLAAAARHIGLPVNRIDIQPLWQGVEYLDPGVSKPYRVNLFLLPLNGFESVLRLCGSRLFEGAYNIGFWFWELPAPHPYWSRFFRYFEEVWVASRFCGDVFQCATNLPVVQIPLVVDGLDREATFSRAHFGFADDVFVFTGVFDVGSRVLRKNPFCLIQAFRKEFGDSTRVLLYLKIWNSSSDPEALRELEAAVQGAPNIRIVDSVFTDSEMASLHRHADCFVSPHRSEGFGLNIAESMYFGKPAIATGYSANLDFMNDSNGYLIDYRLTTLNQSEGPYWKGAVWAEPSEDHLRQLLRRVVDHPEERARKGQAAVETIRQHYSISAVAEAVGARLEEIGLNAADLSRLTLPRHPERAPMFPQSMSDEQFQQVLRQTGPRVGISVLMTVGAGVGLPELQISIQSVREQWYPLWDLGIVENGSAAPEIRAYLHGLRGQDERIRILTGCPEAAGKAVEISMYEYLLDLKPGERLGPQVLLERSQDPSGLPTRQDFYRVT